MALKRTDSGRAVWSSDEGRLCPECGQAVARCRCAEQRRDQVPEGDGVARVRREVKGRRGKTVTTIQGLALASGPLQRLAKELKKKCGAGGAAKDGVIEIQGDHRQCLVEELRRRGYPVKG